MQPPFFFASSGACSIKTVAVARLPPSGIADTGSLVPVVNNHVPATINTRFVNKFVYLYAYILQRISNHFAAILKTQVDITALQQKISLYEDMKAYETLYAFLSPQLNGFCFSFVKSQEVAEEIVSDVFIKLWQIRNKLTEIENLKVYLYTIAKNFCLNYIARNFKNPVLSLDEIAFEPVVNLSGPEELCISADTVNKIQQCIRELPPQCLIIFQLVKEDGMSYKEAAEILNLSVLTVRNQVFIATRKISALIPAYIQTTVINTGRRPAS